MPTYEYADLLIVDTSSSLPSSARRGQYAHTKDTNKLYFYSGSAWTLLGGGATGVGDVTGPSSSVNENIALFSGTTGKAIKDGLTSIGDLKNASNINAGTLALARGGTGASLSDPNADRILFWDDSAGTATWLTAGAGLSISSTTLSVANNSSVRPASISNPRQSPGAYDDEFDSPTLDGSWTRSATGTTVIDGTVHPWSTVTTDCLQDLSTTWPSWLLLQSDESSAQEVSYKKNWTSTTDATFIVGISFPVYTGALSTGEAGIKIRLSNSSDSNEWVYASCELVGGSGRQMRLEVSNNGSLTTQASSLVLGGYDGIAASNLVLFKDGDVYNAAIVGDHGGYLFELSGVTKTGVTTFDRLEVVFTTDARTLGTPSISTILGVDFIRAYDSLTWALKNP